jgi:hypothetical protein
MIASKEKADVLGGHLGLLVELGKVPKLGVYDGEPAISSRRGRQLVYTDDYLRLKGTLAMGSVVLKKGCPERKGVVERANGYLETSFLPGRRFATATTSTASSPSGWSTAPTCASTRACAAGRRSASTRTSPR